VLILRGGGEVVIGGESHELRPHRLFCLRPFVPHRFRATPGDSGGVEHLAVHFDLAPDFPPFANNLRRRPPYEVRLSHGLSLPTRVDLASGHRAEQDLVELVRVRNSGTPTANLEASTLLLGVILLLLKSRRGGIGAGRDLRNEARIQRAVEHAQRHYANDVSLPDLAGVAGLSPTHLSRLFVEWTGQTPAAYIRGLRIDRAREMLAEVDVTIKEVARRTGFKNQYHFSRVFRQVDGLTPSHYREALLAGRR
jgi:AraC-like DNA-binding protein